MSSQGLDRLSDEERGHLFPIEILPYDPTWPKLFIAEQQRLTHVLGPNLTGLIIHFGSTAVPGLAAKPTIDILLEVPEDASRQTRIRSRLQENGYLHIRRTDHPPAYVMFVRGYTLSGYAPPVIHIHAAPVSHADLWSRPAFRDALIGDPKLARRYEALKQGLAQTYRNDREAYTRGKTAFIQSVMRNVSPQPFFSSFSEMPDE